MAEFDIKEEIEGMVLEHSKVMTGDKNQSRFLYYQLKMSMKKAKRIDIIVSFLMESGVRMLLKDLKSALDRGAQIRILTGNYLGITQPSALYLIRRELGNRIDLRFYNDKARSFHPKSYIFHYENMSEIYIGSSNISKSALTTGIEWNYRFSSWNDKESFQLFFDTFEDLFCNHSIVIDDKVLKHYAKNWHRPAVAKDIARYDNDDEKNDTKAQLLFQPRGAQIEALYALDESRKEGATKGLVQASTGIGKTYLAAFDSKKYDKVLFVAHREEILRQAAESFRNVRQSEDYGFFNKDCKDVGKNVLFASVGTLGKLEYLKWFEREAFDYVVIDEYEIIRLEIDLKKSHLWSYFLCKKSKEILNMARFKECRNMKVCEQSGYNYKSTPTIMLKGQWLKECGFDMGTQIVVRCENGKLTITPVVEETFVNSIVAEEKVVYGKKKR